MPGRFGSVSICSTRGTRAWSNDRSARACARIAFQEPQSQSAQPNNQGPRRRSAFRFWRAGGRLSRCSDGRSSPAPESIAFDQSVLLVPFRVCLLRPFQASIVATGLFRVAFSCESKAQHGAGLGRPQRLRRSRYFHAGMRVPAPDPCRSGNAHPGSWPATARWLRDPRRQGCQVWGRFQMLLNELRTLELTNGRVPVSNSWKTIAKLY